jgi:molybdate transport system ATP-binding protein
VASVLPRLALPGLDDRREAGGMLSGRIVEHDERFALTRVAHAAGRLSLPYLELPPGTSVRLRVRARDVSLAVRPPEGLSIRNVLPARIVAMDDDGPGAVDVQLEVAGDELLARITREAATDLGLEPGKPVWALLKTIAAEGAGPLPLP